MDLMIDYVLKYQIMIIEKNKDNNITEQKAIYNVDLLSRGNTINIIYEWIE